MRNGLCIKCSAETVYYADGKHRMEGLKADGGPFLQIYKDQKWIPDIHISQMVSYVCRTCGYLEMFVKDLSVLEKLDDCDNWKKIEATEAFQK